MAKDLHGNEWRFRHIFRGKLFIICALDFISASYDFGIIFTMDEFDLTIRGNENAACELQ